MNFSLDQIVQEPLEKEHWSTLYQYLQYAKQQAQDKTEEAARIYSKLEDYIRSLHSMQNACIFIDIDDAENTIAGLVQIFTKAMSELRTDANRLRRL